MKNPYKVLEEHDQECRAKGKLVGRYISHPYADGEAIYTIVGATDKRVTIEWTNIGDGWVLPAWGKRTTIKRIEAERILEYRDLQYDEQLAARDWWEQRALGETVHYNAGFGQYVRGKIIQDEQGKKAMQVTGLVGDWKQRDIWNREPSGNITRSYYGELLRDGSKLMRPHCSNMAEHPHHRLYNKDVHPKDLPLIEIVIPELTPDQQRLALLVGLRDRVMRSFPELTGDTATDIRLLDAGRYEAEEELRKGLYANQ